MTRFEMEIEGGDHARALVALNDAGIPTIGGGGQAVGSSPAGFRRRFFRSAAFPILLVVVLAFVAQRLIGPEQEEVSYSAFLAQVEREPGTIEKVTIDPDDTIVEVVQRDGEEYETGYPPANEELLVNSLRRQQITTEVKSSGGGSLVSLIFYLLPFLLFFGFFVFLMRRMRSGDTSPAAPFRPESLKAVLEAESPEAAEDRVRQALPRDQAYRVARAKRSP